MLIINGARARLYFKYKVFSVHGSTVIIVVKPKQKIRCLFMRTILILNKFLGNTTYHAVINKFYKVF